MSAFSPRRDDRHERAGVCARARATQTARQRNPSWQALDNQTDSDAQTDRRHQRQVKKSKTHGRTDGQTGGVRCARNSSRARSLVWPTKVRCDSLKFARLRYGSKSHCKRADYWPSGYAKRLALKQVATDEPTDSGNGGQRLSRLSESAAGSSRVLRDWLSLSPEQLTCGCCCWLRLSELTETSFRNGNNRERCLTRPPWAKGSRQPTGRHSPPA